MTPAAHTEEEIRTDERRACAAAAARALIGPLMMSDEVALARDVYDAIMERASEE